MRSWWLSLLFAMLCIPCISSAQLVFCESVDAQGNPLNPSNQFSIGKDGGYFQALVRLNKEIESAFVIYDIFKVDTAGRETFENTIRLETKPYLTWFYKEITFYRPGEYNVYVYDDKDKLLSAARVRINRK